MLNYEIEDATKALSIARSLKNYQSPFTIIDSYRLIDNGVDPEATIQIKAHNMIIHEASTGKGPVDALANVLKKGLTPLFPEITKINLIDFHADILDSGKGTSAVVEVSIIFSDGDTIWKVHALSENINNASFMVLTDGFEYAILKTEKQL